MTDQTQGVGIPTPLKDYYLTFGVMYPSTTHPHWHAADGRGWVRVLAEDEEKARHTVRQHFGSAWCFLYEKDRFKPEVFEKGELAVIVQQRDTDPVRWFTASEPGFYGREPREVVAVRIEGTLKEGSDADAIRELGYEAEFFHLGDCAVEGHELFKEIVDIDMHVLAFELDWSEPGQYECKACGEALIP